MIASVDKRMSLQDIARSMIPQTFHGQFSRKRASPKKFPEFHCCYILSINHESPYRVEKMNLPVIHPGCAESPDPMLKFKYYP
jgi:hypothetical protein